MRPIQPLVRLPHSYIDPNWLSADLPLIPERFLSELGTVKVVSFGYDVYNVKAAAQVKRHWQMKPY